MKVVCRKKERDRDHKNNIHPYKVVEITPPPKCLGIRCFPPVSSFPLFFLFGLRFSFSFFGWLVSNNEAYC